VSRDAVLATLVVILCGSLACLAGFLPSAAPPSGSSLARERAGWRRLWAPLAPAAAALALLVGWALHEPSVTDELLVPAALALAAPLAFVWARALARAVAALRAPRPGVPAAVVGLWRPRLVLDAAFRDALDAPAFQAVLAHEHAHARHRDPLRIWLAQIATDLQWPLGAAPARLAAWLGALEDARDDEARRGGVRGEDLASALLSAARASWAQPPPGAAATLGSEGERLATRVERLLRPLDLDAGPGRTGASLALAALAAGVAAAAVLGWAHGDLVLRALPFVTS
jgi:BlaR1 peptidase M56